LRVPISRSAAVVISSSVLFSFSIACGGGNDGPDQTGPTRTDSTTATVGSSGGVVVTPNGDAGVQIPAGALGQNVTVTVTKLPAPSTPGQGPLPTSLNQYPPYYEVSTNPPNPQINDSIRVGVCQVTDPSSPLYAPEGTHERLQLAHTVGSTTEILEPVSVTDFLNCTGVTADAGFFHGNSRWSRALASIGNRAIRLLSPSSAIAAHGGLGGKVKSFSPFGAVDPLSGLVLGPEFAIAAKPNEEDIGGVAFDGTNYLAALERQDPAGDSVIAQFFSPNGTLVGSSIFLGIGGSPTIAFDGSRYLIVWQTFSGTFNLQAQFLSPSGAKIGNVFSAAFNGPMSPTALVVGGGAFYLTYVRAANTTTGLSMFARRILPDGTLGTQLLLANNTNGFFGNTAFDGNNFFTVYTDGSTVKGRFVSAAGVLGQEVTIFATGPFGETVSVAFNGTNYLVTAAPGATDAEHDAVAQLVSTAGALVGSRIVVANKTTEVEVPVWVIPAGTNFLITYLNGTSGGGILFARARFVSGSGAVRGPAFTIASAANGKAGAGLILGFNNSKYFELILRGIPNPSDPGDIDAWTQKDVLGAFLTIPNPP
jgi:hypothetical protein